MLKRGQVTLYVVLGLVIAALIILIFVLRQNVFLSEWEKQRQLALQVPQQAQEVRDYVDNCLQTIAAEGVTLMGMQGGYIELPVQAIQPTRAHPFSETIEIIPNSGMKTAYWFYATPNGLQKTGMPSKAGMEKALADYIDSHSGRCIDNPELYTRLNATAGPSITEVTINDDSVQFTIDYPVRIELFGFNYRIPKFFVQVNARLGEMAKIGKEIIEKDSADFYLEEKAIDILAMNREIPYSSTEMTCSPKMWTKTNVEKALRNALAVNMQSIRVKGTNFESGNDYYNWDVLAARHKRISTSFKFFERWPIKMDVFPSEGEVLTSKSMFETSNSAMAFLTALFCINDYNFVYDLKYPVLISLEDDNGFMLQFATMVIIDNNQPRENKMGIMDIPGQDERICSSRNANAKIYALAPDRDGNLMPIDNADVKIKCITTVCGLGKTRLDRAAGEPYFSGKIPQCVNALITAEKEGYLDGKQTATTTEGGSISVMMEPYKELDYEIKILQDGAERDVESSETTIVTLENSEKGFSTSLIEPKGKVRLIAGTLNLRTTLISQGYEITIKGKEITHCTKTPMRNVLGILGLTEEKCSTASIPDNVIDQAISGGSTTVWKADRAALYDGSKIVFYIPAHGVPSTTDEMETIYDEVENPANAVLPAIE